MEQDPYEQQLMKLFDSYDVDRLGSLDKNGLTQLCQSLQLEEDGHELIKAVLKQNGKKRANFDEFKNALLNLLKKQNESKNKCNNSNKDFNSLNSDCNNLNNEGSNFNNSNTDFNNLNKDGGNLNNESVEGEISPKYVYGSKKYGRRSRPRSEDLTVDRNKSQNVNLNQNGCVQKSNSQSEITVKKRKTSNLKRCVSVPSNCELFLNDPIINCDFICTEEMLKHAWDKLGVGKDGFLSQTELILVCEAIGLQELAGGVLRQLSNKTNAGFGGKIGFQELLDAIREDDAWSDVFNSTLQSTNSDLVGLEKDGDSVFYPNSCMMQYITLGPDGNGIINTEAVIEMWESAGITSPKILLSDLGFNTSEINIIELANVLEKEIKGLNESNYQNPHIALLQAFLTLYQTEIKCLKSILEQMQAEREKLKGDVYEANNRASLLAQEVDDNHGKMEKKAQNEIKLLEQRHNDILKGVLEQFNGDKEQMALLNKNLEDKIINLESEENKLINDLTIAKKYSASLEKENNQLRIEIIELNKVKNLLSDEINILESEKDKFGELEQNKLEPLLSKLSILQSENSKLRDKNDEMSCEIESLNGQINLLRPKIASTSNSASLEIFSDEFSSISTCENVGLGAKRRNGDSPSKDLKTFGLVDGSPRLGKVRKFQKNKDSLEIPFTSSESGFDVELDSTESSSTSLVEQYEIQAQLQARINLLEDILKQHSISFPTPTSNLDENDATMKTTNLAEHCRNLEETLTNIEINNCKCCQNCEITKIKAALTRKNDVAKPDVHDKSTETAPNSNFAPSNSNLETENEKLRAEIKTLKSKIEDLENCVELLKNEYEKCEDYWANKLDEERQIFEQEQIANNDKLTELFTKIEEYEKQFSISNFDDNRLSTIEENFNLETQFNDLEEEYQQYKNEAEMQLDEKNNEIFLLREKLAELTVNKPDLVDFEVQVDYLNQFEVKINKNANVKNLSCQIVESTNLFSSDTQPTDVTTCSNDAKTYENDLQISGNDVLDGCLPEKNLYEHLQKLICENGKKIVENLYLGHENNRLRFTIDKNDEITGEMSLEHLQNLIKICDSCQKILNLQKIQFSPLKSSGDALFVGLQPENVQINDNLAKNLRKTSICTNCQSAVTSSEIIKNSPLNELLPQNASSMLQNNLIPTQNANLGCDFYENNDLTNSFKNSANSFNNSSNSSNSSSKEGLFSGENTTQSLPLNILWENAHQNIKKTSYSMLNLNVVDGAPNELNTTPCRPKRTRKYERNPLSSRKSKKSCEKGAAVDQKNFLGSKIGTEVPEKNSGLSFGGFEQKHAPNKEEGTCLININILHNLNAKLAHLDQKCRHLQMVLKQQHFQADQMLQHCWQQHRQEKGELQFLLKANHEKLEQQFRLVNEQQEKLARSDMLVKELYVENSYLIANVQRLEQQCHMLAMHCNSTNNSV